MAIAPSGCRMALRGSSAAAPLLRSLSRPSALQPRLAQMTTTAEMVHGVPINTAKTSAAATPNAKPHDEVDFVDPPEYDPAATQELGIEDLFSDTMEPLTTEVVEDGDCPFDGEGMPLQEAIMTASFEEGGAGKKPSVLSSTDLALMTPDSDVLMPTYNRRKLRAGIVHFGVGGFFRAHQMVYMDYLMRHNIDGNRNWAYVGVGVLPHDKVMRDALKQQDFMYTVIAHSATAVSTSGHSDEDFSSEENLKENVRVVAAMKDMLMAPEEPGEVMRQLCEEDVKIFSLTITEFGYTVPTSKADLALLEIARSAAREPWDEMNNDKKTYQGATAVGMITAGLAARRAAGSGGASILSCDNIPGNGDYVREKVLERADSAGNGLKEWIEFNCTFPNSMVDRITPITSDKVKAHLAEKHGIQDQWPVACETFAQWVIEDNFAEGISGRPRWEDVGVQMVPDVRPFELAKIRLLNVTHSVMVFPALLMGLEYIFEAATHPTIKQFYTYVMEKELRPALETIPGIDAINLPRYQEILIERFSNVLVADTLMRVAMDTSQKFSVQGSPATADGLELDNPMDGMAFMIACWGHFIRKSMRAQLPVKDGKADVLTAAMESDDINQLLDYEPIFHGLLFEEEWREKVCYYYDAIKYNGIRKALRTFNQEHADALF